MQLPAAKLRSLPKFPSTQQQKLQSGLANRHAEIDGIQPPKRDTPKQPSNPRVDACRATPRRSPFRNCLLNC